MESLIYRNEIGSEFWSVPVQKNANELFPRQTQWYLSGRSALNAILSSVRGHTAALPSWCCDSMIKPFLDHGMQVCFYSVNGSEQNLQGVDADVLLVMDYFGFTGYSKVPKEYRGIVIRDVTHSMFSTQYSDAHFIFGSMRKWCGTWTGGFAWSNCEYSIPEAKEENFQVINLRKQAMTEKQQYMVGNTDSKAYLDLFAQAEECLDGMMGYASADSRDIDVALHINASLIRNARRDNAAVLMEELKDYCIFTELKENDCPLFVPIQLR